MRFIPKVNPLKGGGPLSGVPKRGRGHFIHLLAEILGKAPSEVAVGRDTFKGFPPLSRPSGGYTAKPTKPVAENFPIPVKGKVLLKRAIPLSEDRVSASSKGFLRKIPTSKGGRGERVPGLVKGFDLSALLAPGFFVSALPKQGGIERGESTKTPFRGKGWERSYRTFTATDILERANLWVNTLKGQNSPVKGGINFGKNIGLVLGKSPLKGFKVEKIPLERGDIDNGLGNRNIIPLVEGQKQVQVLEKISEPFRVKRVIKPEHYNPYTKGFSIKIPLEENTVLHIRVVRDNFYAKILTSFENYQSLVQNLPNLTQQVSNLGFGTTVIKLQSSPGRQEGQQRGDRNGEDKRTAFSNTAKRSNFYNGFVSFSFYL